MTERKRSGIVCAVVGIYTLLAVGCASYVTPGGGVELASLAETDIKELMSKKPEARFPAHLAVARVQTTGYHSY